MCWFWKKNIKHPPILEKYKRCNNCQKLFNINHANYLKLKKNRKNVYYCENKCYVKYVNIGNEFFDIAL
jgi:hypothetical protein